MKIFLLLITLIPLQLWGMEKKLSWQECLELLKQNSLDLQVARQNHQSSEQTLQSISGLFYPQFSASLTYGQESSQSSTTGEQIKSTSYGASLNANLNLFNGFGDQGKHEQALANERISFFLLNITSAQVQQTFKTAYATLLHAQKSLHLYQEIIRRRTENLSLVELRYENGRENRGSVLLSKANLNQAQYEKLLAENNFENSQIQLSHLIGFNSEVLQVSDTPPLEKPTKEVNWHNLVLAHPEYQQTLFHEQASNANLKISKSIFYPSLNLTSSTGKTGGEWTPTNDRWSAGLTLSLPLFSGGKDYYSVQSASALAAASHFATQNTYQQLFEKLNQNYKSYIAAIEKAKVDESFLLAAQTRAEIARSKYNNGLISFDDWDLIENDLMTRQKNALSSQRDQMIAEANWLQAQGKGVLP